MPDLDKRSHWENLHQSFRQKINGVYLLSNGSGSNPLRRYNRTTGTVQTLIRGARRRRVRLRAVGSGWSFSPVAATDGFLLNTKQLTLPFSVKKTVTRKGSPAGLFLFQCGMTISAIGRYLRKKRRSLKTTGASNGQTLAGAVSTGTHGAALDFGSMQDFVVAIHLATGQARSVWLERASYPVVKASLAKKLDADLVRDDALFDAALVGFGSFGVTLGLLVATAPRFLLETHRLRQPLNDDLMEAMNTQSFTGLDLPRPGVRPHHFELLINPHDLGGDTEAMVTVMYKQPYRDDYDRPALGEDDVGLGDDALAFLSRFFDLLPFGASGPVIRRVVTSILASQYKAFAAQLGTQAEVFAATSSRGKLASSGIAVPAERTSDALDLLLRTHKRYGPFPGAIGMRFVKGTRATLGFTRYPQTCVLELDGVYGDRARRFYGKLWPAFERSDIPHTYHWGKLHRLTPRRVANMYGNAVEDWIAARKSLLGTATREVFSSPFLESIGLTR
ncbi:MAG: FAD-binding protein [Planctomycetota bacterium]|nr:FAD-binding protein [Planctomycetota bacterium]